MSSPSSFLHKGIETVSKAVEQDNLGNYEDAEYLYSKSIELLNTATKHEENVEKQNLIKEKTTMYEKRLKDIQLMLLSKSSVGVASESVVKSTPAKTASTSLQVTGSTPSANPPSTKSVPISSPPPSSGPNQPTKAVPPTTTTTITATTADFSAFHSRGIEFIKKAVNDDEKKNYSSALRNYTCGLEYLVSAVKYEKDSKNKKLIEDKIGSYLNRAEQLKQIVKANSDPQETRIEELSKELVAKEATIRKLMEENTILKFELSKGSGKSHPASSADEVNRLKNELQTAKQKIEELELVWDVVKSVKGE